MNKILMLLILTGMCVGCALSKEELKQQRERRDNESLSMFPEKAEQVETIGNGWFLFSLEVDGEKKRFLYHGYWSGHEGGLESLTEISQR